MTGNLVTVERNGRLINIEEDQLRKNDVVILQTGELAPADIRLTETSGIEADEFELTGEINPVVKKTGDLIRIGTKILKGKARGTVVATGEETEYGNVLKQTLEERKTYPFKLFKSSYLVPVLLLLPALIFKLSDSQHPAAVILEYVCLSVALILLQNGDLFRQTLFSREVRKLERLKIEVRDPETMETLQKIDTVCFDKTGVLTTRFMNVKNIYSTEKKIRLEELAKKSRLASLIKTGCALCNDILFYEKIETATAVDKALISFSKKCGVDVHDLFQSAKRVYDMPFNSGNRYMSCGFRLDSGETVYFAKGDPEVILDRCSRALTASGMETPIDGRALLACKSNAKKINREGGTVLALAFTTETSDGVPADYVFLCLLEFENALQSGATEVVNRLKNQGIRCIILTGDRDETAVKIGENCGITEDSAAFLPGLEIEKMALDEVARQSDYCSIFSRLMPSQKGIVVRLLRQRHHTVAMIGDGPNDGIALEVADVGISFQENSSPIARRLADILIRKLPDVLRLLEGADRAKREVAAAGIFRAFLTTAILLSQYGWLFELIFNSQ